MLQFNQHDKSIHLKVKAVEYFTLQYDGAKDDLQGYWIGSVRLGKLHCALKISREKKYVIAKR